MNYRWMVIKIAFMDSHLVEQGNEIHEPTKNWDGKWVTHAFMSRFFPTQKRSHLAKPWSCRIRRQKVAEPKYMLFFIFTISNLNGKSTWFSMVFEGTIKSTCLLSFLQGRNLEQVPRLVM